MNRSKEKPILFSTEEVRAILEGRKTMTRRPIDPCKEGYWQRSVMGEETWHNPIEAWECVWHNKRPKWVVGDFVRVKGTDIVLELTAVRVERLQDIKNSRDVFAEGISSIPYMLPGETEVPGLYEGMEIYRFRRLWDRFNAKRGYGWDTNPWVYVISFRGG